MKLAIAQEGDVRTQRQDRLDLAEQFLMHGLGKMTFDAANDHTPVHHYVQRLAEIVSPH
jgi:hypothetical protein